MNVYTLVSTKDRIMNLCAHPICGILPVNCPIPYKNARVCVPKNLMPSWKNTVLSKHTKLRKNQSLANVDCRLSKADSADFAQ